jgi:hypothetical protein
MYTLFCVVLKDCSYSNSAIQLLNSYNVKYKKILITRDDAEKYKMPEINTFPKIYLKKKSQTLLLGGFTELKEFLDTFINQKYDENKVNTYKNKYAIWNKHSILRLIELINLK